MLIVAAGRYGTRQQKNTVVFPGLRALPSTTALRYRHASKLTPEIGARNLNPALCTDGIIAGLRLSRTVFKASNQSDPTLLHHLFIHLILFIEVFVFENHSPLNMKLFVFLLLSVFALSHAFDPSIISVSKMRDYDDGLIGICPAALFRPISRCFCYGLFAGKFKTTKTAANKSACLRFPGGTLTQILSKEDFCIPFLTKTGRLRTFHLVRHLNQLLKVCKESTRITLK